MTYTAYITVGPNGQDNGGVDIGTGNTGSMIVYIGGGVVDDSTGSWLTAPPGGVGGSQYASHTTVSLPANNTTVNAAILAQVEGDFSVTISKLVILTGRPED